MLFLHRARFSSSRRTRPSLALDLAGPAPSCSLRIAAGRPSSRLGRGFVGENSTPRQPSLESIRRTRDFLSKLGEKLGIKPGDYESWYNVEFIAISKAAGGEGHLKKFNRSRVEMLSRVFSEHTWHPWLFKQLKGKEKLSDTAAVSFARYLEEKLGLSRPEDWYSISPSDLVKCGVPRLFYSQAEFIEFLRRAYPNIHWESQKMAWSSMGLSHLHSTLNQLFPGFVVPAKSRFPKESFTSVAYISRTFVVPSLDLMFEYQGPIDYAKQILADKEMLAFESHPELERLAKREGLTLISVPFWWNREINSLLATIWNTRKDLFAPEKPLSKWMSTLSSSEPIPALVELTPLSISAAYIRRWSQDERFRDYFPETGPVDGDMRTRKVRRRKPVSEKLDSESSIPIKLRRPREEKTSEPKERSKPRISLGFARVELQKQFELNPNPGLEHRKELAQELGISLFRVSVWFRRKRESFESQVDD